MVIGHWTHLATLVLVGPCWLSGQTASGPCAFTVTSLRPFTKLGVLSQRTEGRPAPLSRAPCRPRGLQPAPITLNNVTSDV